MRPVTQAVYFGFYLYGLHLWRFFVVVILNLGVNPISLSLISKSPSPHIVQNRVALKICKISPVVVHKRKSYKFRNE